MTTFTVRALAKVLLEDMWYETCHIGVGGKIMCPHFIRVMV